MIYSCIYFYKLINKKTIIKLTCLVGNTSLIQLYAFHSTKLYMLRTARGCIGLRSICKFLFIYLLLLKALTIKAVANGQATKSNLFDFIRRSAHVYVMRVSPKPVRNTINMRPIHKIDTIQSCGLK